MKSIQIVAYTFIIIWGMIPWISEYLKEEKDYTNAACQSLAFYSFNAILVALAQIPAPNP